MRVLIFYSILFLTMFSCKQEHNKINNESLITYKVKKLDSTPDLYLIYGISSGEYFKIISEKEMNPVKECNTIKLNEEYKFKLDTLYSQRGIYEHVSAVGYKDKTPVSFEGDSITVLYSSKNIKGLCYYPD